MNILDKSKEELLLELQELKAENTVLKSLYAQHNSMPKQTEESLYQSKDSAFILSILESQPEIIVFSLDKNYCYTAFTTFHKETIKNIWGAEIKIGMNILDVITNPEDRQRAKNNFNRALGGDYFVLTEEYGDKALHRTFYENCYGPIKDSDNMIVGVSVFVIDITFRKQTEDALRESNELLTAFMKHSPIHTFIKDVTNTESRVILASENYKDMIGIPGSEMVGKTMEELFPAEHAAKFTADDWLVVTQGKVLHLDEDLNDRYYHTIKFPIQQRGKNLLAGFTIDITERKMVEKALKESELKYRSLIENSSDTIFCVDEKGEYQFTNNLFASTFGKSPDYFVGKTFWDIYSKEQADRRFSITSKVFETGESDSFEVEVPLMEKTLYFLGKANPIKDDTGKVVLALVFSTDITKRLQSEQALKESEEKYRLLVENTNSGIFQTNLDGTFIQMNKATSEMAGYDSVEELMSKSADCLYANIEDREKLIALLALNGEVRNLEMQSLKKDGNIYWISMNAVVLKDKEGKSERVLGIVNDITERKNAENSLMEIESRYNLFVNTHTDLIFIKDEKLRYIMVNDATCRFFGKSREEMLFKTDYDLMDEAGAKVCEYTDNLVLGANSPVVSEEHIDDRYYETTKFQLALNDNKMGLGSIIRDITERKLVDEALQKSETLYRTLVENIPQKIFIKDLNSKYLSINENFARDLQIQPEDIVGKSDFDLYPPEIASKYRADDLRILENGQTENFEEIYIVDGKRTWVHTIKAPINDKNGNVTGLCGVFIDITERKQAEVEIQMKNVELGELNASKDKLFSIIAHDLRSPFNGFLGLTKIMAENMNNITLEELQQISSSIQDSATNLFALLENLLEWSRMQRGISEFRPENCLIDSIVKQNLEFHSGFAKQKNILLMNNVVESIHVNADIRMLNTVFRNLISNAIKFTPSGGRIEIGAVIKPSEGYTQIYIKDSGIGISEETIKKLFRIDEKVSHPGTAGEPSTGLGLVLCKEFIEKHDGKIWVESEEGKGSIFFFTLPKTNN